MQHSSTVARSSNSCLPLRILQRQEWLNHNQAGIVGEQLRLLLVPVTSGDPIAWGAPNELEVRSIARQWTSSAVLHPYLFFLDHWESKLSTGGISATANINSSEVIATGTKLHKLNPPAFH